MIDYKKYINALRKCAKEHENDKTFTGHIIVSDLCQDTANLLQELEQEPREGHWEHGKELGKEYQGRLLVDVTYEDWHCSNCNYVIKGTVKPKWNYCPNCGSKMGGGRKCR